MSLTAGMFDFTMTVEERISKARIRLRRIAPFFSFIVERLRIKRDDRFGTMAVTPKGQCFYNEEFVMKLTDNQLIGVLVHEVMHCALRHLTRGEGREVQVNGISLFNWVCDAQINQMISENKLELPSNAITANSDDSIDFGPIHVEAISTKSAEEMYDEIFAQLKRQQLESGGSSSSGGGKGDFDVSEEIQDTLDEHLKKEDDSNDGDGSDDSNDGDSEEGKSSKGKGKDDSKSDSSDGGSSEDIPAVDWSDILSKAHAYAKLQGSEPAGFERMFADLHKPKVCWRAILRRTVASSIPEEFTWKRPHKKYVPHDIYLPSTYGETIKVVCAIDTSGSISHDTLTDFISEIVGISKAYHEAEFIILSHDVDVHDEIPVRNGYRDKLSKMELHGGGGTSHIPMFEHVEQHKNSWDLETTVVISFTDGYSSFPEKRPKVDQVVFVLAGGHCPKEHLPDWADIVLTIE